MDWKEEADLVRSIRARHDSVIATLRKERQELSSAMTSLKAANDAQEILQHLAQAVQEHAHKRIADVVSSCLAAVFEDPYEFKITFERKRGRTEARLSFVRDGLEVDPLTASGGGMVDVASFAFRVACLMLHQPKLSRVVVLDEPFRYVSAQYQDNVRMMLEKLSEDLRVQIIFITHNPALATGRIIDLTR